MPVYVDDFQQPAQVKCGRATIRARWSHLTADTTEELHEFAINKLGMKREWFQPQTTRQGKARGRDHYDVTESKRREAIRLGAIPVRCGNEPWREKTRDEIRKQQGFHAD